MNQITLIRLNSISKGTLFVSTCTITKFTIFRSILPFATNSANLAIVATGKACVVHPPILLTYLGIEDEIIVPLFP